MITIGLHNIDEIIFQNENIYKALPEFKHLFDSHRVSVSIPFLGNLGLRTKLEFIHTVSEKQKEIISNILQSEIYFLELNLDQIHDYSGSIEDIEFFLPTNKNIHDFAIARNKDKIFVTLYTGDNDD